MFALTSTARAFGAMPSLVLLLCSLGLTAAYPEQYALHSYLNSRQPKYYGHEYINPRLKLQSEDDDDFNDTESAPMVNGVLASQNRKYLAKTPEHDAHFRTILRQQEAATIKDPTQAAMVANDQMELRSRLRHSLQTSDDDVYEVESAPVMKSTPYRSGRYRKQREQRGPHESLEAHEPQQQQPEDMEVPVSVAFQSEIDHSSYEPTQQQQQQPKRHRDVAYAKQMPMKFMEEGENTEPEYEGNPDKYSRPYPVQENAHFSMGLVDDDNNNVRPSYKQQRPGRPQRAKVSSYHHQPSHYQQIEYSQAPADNYQQEKTPRYYVQTESEYRGPGSYSASAPATSQYMQHGHARQPVYASQPASHHSPRQYKAAPMESSWLDMGAYSSGKGAFGWYSDVPVGGPQAEKKK